MRTWALGLVLSTAALAQQPAVVQPAGAASVAGVVTDTDDAAIPGAKVRLLAVESKAVRQAESDATGVFSLEGVEPGRYTLTIAAKGFAEWKIRDVLVVHPGENVVVPQVQLGVEEITTSVNAIMIEDLAEEQITAEEHQRILAILPNFYVSYLKQAAPLTRKQKFKLAFRVSTDPVTFMTTGISAGIQDWQGDFAGYGRGLPGYASRYGATYGDKLSATMLGAAVFPSLFHQDPRYFYKGTGHVVVRALYAISTVVICKGDNGRWQPNYSNVLGNLGAAGISVLYYPASDRHGLQVTVDNTLIGIGSGSIGTLFQEFLLKRFTHGVPVKTPAVP